jgi:hypothetical protein
VAAQAFGPVGDGRQTNPGSAFVDLKLGEFEGGVGRRHTVSG